MQRLHAARAVSARQEAVWISVGDDPEGTGSGPFVDDGHPADIVSPHERGRNDEVVGWTAGRHGTGHDLFDVRDTLLT